MSAIGSFAVLRRHDFSECLDKAGCIRSVSTGRWLFKKTEVVGISEFRQSWQAAVVEESSFDYSGYVLGDYLDVQLELNRFQVADEQSDAARVLCKAFTTAFPFEAPVMLPELESEPLLAFCREEYGNDAQGMVEALKAAHLFYQKGLAKITSENLVVFIIR